jgi:deazaflavin-dependent oxidoreductase (nitroreductase family)
MTQHGESARLPPRPFIHFAWAAHRSLYRISHGRLGLRESQPDRWGTMQLTTTGRRSGQPRSVILAFVEDGPNLVTIAMNGWDPAEPAWWLNLKHQPRASVTLPDGSSRTVTAREARGEERDRLWERYRGVTPHLDAYADRRGSPTAIVVLEPNRDTPR